MSGSKAIRTEIVRSANEMVGELGKKPLADLLKHHTKRSMQNLVTKAEKKINSKLEGRGIKRRAALENNFSQIVKRLKTTSDSGKLKKKTLATKKIGNPISSKGKKKKSSKDIFLEKYSLKKT